jgi:branched-chain amino acid transport system ATP-binding protein
MSTLLELRGLEAGYDGVPVVRDLDLHVDEGEVVLLLGPNGAGKTTTLLTAAGLLEPLGGEVVVAGLPLTRRRNEAARRGLALVPEDRALFPELTVWEHVRVGAHGKRARAQRALAAFPELAEMSRRRAGVLSGGQQQMLAIARALATEPRLLVVDEMSLGLAPIIVQRLLAQIRLLAHDGGLGVLLVEQHAHLALGSADRAYVLNHGDLVLEGRASELAANRELVESSYLGQAVLDEAAAGSV